MIRKQRSKFKHHSRACVFVKLVILKTKKTKIESKWIMSFWKSVNTFVGNKSKQLRPEETSFFSLDKESSEIEQENQLEMDDCQKDKNKCYKYTKENKKNWKQLYIWRNGKNCNISLWIYIYIIKLKKVKKITRDVLVDCEVEVKEAHGNVGCLATTMASSRTRRLY